MNRKLEKALSTGILLAFCITSFTACGSRKETTAARPEPIKEITADMPWYDTRTLIVDEDIDRRDYHYLSNDIIGVWGDNILVVIKGDLIADITAADFEGNTSVKLLRYFDLNGDLEEEVDLGEIVTEYACHLRGESYENERYELVPPATETDIGEIYLDSNMFRKGDTLILSGYSGVLGCDLEFVYDIAGRKILSHEQIDPAELEFTLTDDYVVYEGYEIRPTAYYGSDITFEIESPEGEVRTLSVADELPEVGIPNYIMNYVWAGDGKTIVYMFNEDFEQKRFILDYVNGQLISLNGDTSYDWLDDIVLGGISYSEGIGNVVAGDEGIYLIDFDAKDTSMILDYDCCNINRFDCWSLVPLYMTDDKIVLAGYVFRGAGEYYTDDVLLHELVILDRAEVNPNAGKTVLNAAFIDGNLTYPAAEAIRQFNEESSDAIIMVDPRYTQTAFADQLAANDNESYESYMRRYSASVVTSLSVDLMSGDGPDIIFGGIANTQLNTPDLLLDLSSSVNRDECFSTIIDDSMTGDALYQLPLSFTVDGILTREENVRQEGAGFTFDSYRDFIYGPCNGSEPTGLGQVDFMNLCLEQMSDMFYRDGSYNYDNAEFRDLAEFTSEMITDSEYSDDVIYMDYTADLPEASYVRVYSAKQMLSLIRGPVEGYRMMGLPSSDARGPVANIRDSVAISASTAAAEPCMRFVNLLTSEEYQALFAANSGFSINRNAFESESRRAVDDANYKYDNYYSQYYSFSDLYGMGLPVENIDADAFTSTLESYADSVSGIGFMDAPVQVIVSEEIQAYFAGQKSLDEVIGIIDDRVATYVNERAN